MRPDKERRKELKRKYLEKHPAPPENPFIIDAPFGIIGFPETIPDFQMVIVRGKRDGQESENVAPVISSSKGDRIVFLKKKKRNGLAP